ncbi:UDP-N-acetylglucosamine transferase subunit ALG14-like protein [Leptotrombidium deliense]|uniref:UDP-N-acetylglucosamine transferase subunit ALG14 n=1 Tax=Leptotrombidium deliense TaxID=299467 RepID=A0A443SWZ5_9ACAR|nr:UDP-N-acetylglucosamine transferase subunit ALG14-like protein [Leptotrombidium deliense]
MEAFHVALIFWFAFSVLFFYWKKRKERLTYPLKTMVVLGSGGHTSEMLQLVKHIDLNAKYKPVVVVIAKEDKLSYRKLLNSDIKDKKVLYVSRSRKVGQSYLTSVFTTLVAFFEALYICLRERPKLLLCNGPGTCIPYCVALRLTSFTARQVFIESFCRTKTLSLSGRIAYFICDHVLVQWPFLAKKYSKCVYKGLLV